LKSQIVRNEARERNCKRKAVPTTPRITSRIHVCEDFLCAIYQLQVLPRLASFVVACFLSLRVNISIDHSGGMDRYQEEKQLTGNLGSFAPS
jgi:hypothetical protein